MPAPRPELPVAQFDDDAAWEAWLTDQHAASPGIWMKFAKKGAATATVTHAEALQTAICFGWIDGQVRPLDESFYLMRFTPRGPKSKWSRINREKAQALIAAGRMRPAGQAAIAAAQADGRWDAAYEPQSAITVPPDLQRALDAEPAAAEFFATLRGQQRYAFLYRLHHVKSPEARRKRIERYIELLRAGQTLN